MNIFFKSLYGDAFFSLRPNARGMQRVPLIGEPPATLLNLPAVVYGNIGGSFDIGRR